MTFKLRKLLLSAMSFSIAPMLTACYGIIDAQFKYRLEGRVTDTESQPIEGIRVIRCLSRDVDKDRPYLHADTTFTDAKGVFDFGARSESQHDPDNLGDNPVVLLVEDVDGGDNGGEFESWSSESINVKAGVNKVFVTLPHKR